MSDDIEAFWTRAITRARLNQVEVVTGPEGTTSLTPPAWSFAPDEMGDQLTEQVLAGDKTVVMSLEAEYGDDEGETELPRVGELSILCWNDGRPAALLETKNVKVCQFKDVSDADISGDGDLISADNRREMFTQTAQRYGVDFTDDTPVVVETFKVVLGPE